MFFICPKYSNQSRPKGANIGVIIHTSIKGQARWDIQGSVRGNVSHISYLHASFSRNNTNVIPETFIINSCYWLQMRILLSV